MVNRNLIRDLEDVDIADEFEKLFPEDEPQPEFYEFTTAEKSYDVNKIVEGRVIRLDAESVLVDVGFKSEGTIPRDEWDEGEDPPAHGYRVHIAVADCCEGGDCPP